MIFTITDDIVKKAVSLKSNKYKKYKVKQIYYWETEYKEDSIIVWVTDIEKKFLGIWRKKHKRQVEINFEKAIIRQNYYGIDIKCEFDIDIAIDEDNEVIYWKDKGERFTSFNYDSNERYKANAIDVDELQKHLNFLNIGDKPYDIVSLKAHYKKLAKLYHPDIVGGDGEMMAKINVAYDYIMETLTE